MRRVVFMWARVGVWVWVWVWVRLLQLPLPPSHRAAWAEEAVGGGPAV